MDGSRARGSSHYDTVHRTVKKIRVRLDDDVVRDLDELAADLRLVRSDIARQALGRGMKCLRMDRALERYLHQEFTLCRAAEYAGLSIYEMSEEAAKRSIPYFRYPADELARDADAARGWREARTA